MKRFYQVVVIIVMVSIFVAGCQKKPGEEELFEQARVLQEKKEFDQAINNYKEIINLYPDGDRCDEAQFMIGFIYANDMNDTTMARAAYKAFIDNYSTKADTGMLLSAKWEVEHLGRDISEIEQLQGFTAEATETKDETSEEPKEATTEK
ncbi:MAG: tetratricopeptide repeat protein [Candidatus Electryonea clarkiae]|nr:tetratricopeptide repeat protein [Candidatus Electryonea clarkiae]MDP8286145.1 tetratricopeptide repeat protein [Candidatus Electryonea clarkiae]